MIGLEHLQVIETIVSEGSFQKASENLFKARSAISYSVKKVEDSYQIEIFDRSQYRPNLTGDGQLLLDKIRPLLRAAKEFDGFARQIGSEVESEIRVGVSALYSVKPVIGVLKKVKENFPNTIVHLEIENVSGERLLRDEKVTIGIYSVLDESPEIDYRLLDHHELAVYTSTNFPVLSNELSLTDLAKYPQVIIKSSYKESPNHGVLDGATHWYVSDHHAKLDLIESGLCWGRLPKSNVHSTKLIEQAQIATMKVPVYAARKKGLAQGPVAEYIFSELEQTKIDC